MQFMDEQQTNTSDVNRNVAEVRNLCANSNRCNMVLYDVIRIETTNKLLFDSTNPSEDGRVIKEFELNNEEYEVENVFHNVNMAQVTCWNKKEKVYYYYNLQTKDCVVG